MANEMVWKVKFNDDILRAIAQAPTEGLNRMAEHTAAEAKRRTPVKTGLNKRSINWDTPRGGVRRIYTESGYGGFLETGTKFMAARPYMRPGLQDAINRAPTILKGLVKE